MASDERRQKRPKAAEKFALKAAALSRFMQLYQRRAQSGGTDPNDRHYDRDLEKTVKRMNPQDLDRLLHGDEE
jgi:hypothetical protein